ncbi:hypothetical protein [Scrofimicrobium sp. R131]|uniref:Uncharacterized protein n=1 Tax=Scrofimicrobium appendicitidis TaxID=3079930 RepID=A0AAU7V8A1_9ACTO
MTAPKLGPTWPAVLWWTLGVGVGLILVLPWLVMNLAQVGEAGMALGFLQLLLLNPIVFLVGVWHTWTRVRRLVWVTTVGYSLAFVASAYLAFNSSALVYLVGYLLLSLVPVGLSWAWGQFRRWQERRP